MAKAETAVKDVGEATGGVALAESPSAAPTVRIPAVNLGPHSHRFLPEALADAAEPLMAIGTAVGVTVVDQIAVHNGPIAGMVSSRDGNRLLVTNYGEDSVSAIDTAGGDVVTTATGLSEPFAIATGAAGGDRAYLSTASPAYDGLAAVDLGSGDLVARHPLALSVRDVAVSPEGKRVYASRTGVDGADVAVLDTTTERVAVIDVVTAPGAAAGCLAISPDGKRLYLATQRPSGSHLVVIDTGAHRVVDAVEIGSPIQDIALSRDGGIAYIASCDPDLGGVIDIIDTRANVLTGSVGIGAIGGLLTQLTLSNDGHRAYLVTGNGVTVMSTLTHDVVGTVTVDAQPSCLAESVDGSHLYIADYSGTVTVVSIVLTAAALVGEVGDRPELPELESVLV